MASNRFNYGARGFTLLESMVALAIVALGMMAVHTQLNRFVISAVITEEKTLASWIASNKLTELSVATTWPEVGTSDDEVEFAQRDWQLEIEVSETQVENLRRADVRVFLSQDPDRLIHTLSALIEPPPPAGFLPVRWFSAEIGAGG
ncbi:MAG: type II secretion system minor pseudopilin GspI [Gammaproteobacteria bacterium]|nr:type II secretion system minor pseudopilin GspI [Gammaproteobacteria bacterium]